MPSPSLLASTEKAIGGDALGACDSRSLLLTRYARPLPGPERQSALQKIINVKENSDAGLKSWRAWLASAADPKHLIHAQLEARLLINIGGTVMENAGLALDRFGTAYIPGSAVKACARRTALAALRQWCESGQKPVASDDGLAPVCEGFAGPGELLLAILRVFGCTDLEWGPYDPSKNDLAWACGDDLAAERNQWRALSANARAALNATPGVDLKELKPTRRGTVAFLPSYPNARPSADLELDVLTSHHPAYYGGDMETATDTENPIPVYFPAVAAGAIYTFAVLPVGKPDTKLLGHAITWLLTGLKLFGLGAKTAAGYGYFKDVTDEISKRVAKEAADKRRETEEAANNARKAAEEDARLAEKRRRDAMTSVEKADAQLADRAANWGWMKDHLTKFSEHSPAEQAALLRWFCSAGRERWLTEIKPGAAKGKKPWSQIINAIHAAEKNHKIDLP